MVLLLRMTGFGKRKWRSSYDADVMLTYFLSGCVDGFTKMATVAVVGNSPGKDAIAEGLLDLLKPAIQQLDLHVHSVR